MHLLAPLRHGLPEGLLRGRRRSARARTLQRLQALVGDFGVVLRGALLATGRLVSGRPWPCDSDSPTHGRGAEPCVRLAPKIQLELPATP